MQTVQKHGLPQKTVSWAEAEKKWINAMFFLTVCFESLIGADVLFTQYNLNQIIVYARILFHDIFHCLYLHHSATIHKAFITPSDMPHNAYM